MERQDTFHEMILDLKFSTQGFSFFFLSHLVEIDSHINMQWRENFPPFMTPRWHLIVKRLNSLIKLDIGFYVPAGGVISVVGGSFIEFKFSELHKLGSFRCAMLITKRSYLTQIELRLSHDVTCEFISLLWFEDKTFFVFSKSKLFEINWIGGDFHAEQIEWFMIQKISVKNYFP